MTVSFCPICFFLGFLADDASVRTQFTHVLRFVPIFIFVLISSRISVNDGVGLTKKMFSPVYLSTSRLIYTWRYNFQKYNF